MNIFATLFISFIFSNFLILSFLVCHGQWYIPKQFKNIVLNSANKINQILIESFFQNVKTNIVRQDPEWNNSWTLRDFVDEISIYLQNKNFSQATILINYVKNRWSHIVPAIPEKYLVYEFMGVYLHRATNLYLILSFSLFEQMALYIYFSSYLYDSWSSWVPLILAENFIVFIFIVNLISILFFKPFRNMLKYLLLVASFTTYYGWIFSLLIYYRPLDKIVNICFDFINRNIFFCSFILWKHNPFLIESCIVFKNKDNDKYRYHLVKFSDNIENVLITSEIEEIINLISVAVYYYPVIFIDQFAYDEWLKYDVVESDFKDHLSTCVPLNPVEMTLMAQ